MSRRGFALLAVLWILVGITGLLAVSVSGLRTGNRVTRNRVLMARARWGAEACLEIAQARWPTAPDAHSGAEALGRDVRCRWTIDDPIAALNVNLTDSATLSAAFALAGAPGGSAALWAHRIVRRRIASSVESIAELEEWPGFPASLSRLLTVEGTGQVSIGAPNAILEAFPGITAEASALLERRRELKRPVVSLDELSGLLSPVSRSILQPHYAELSSKLIFRPQQLRVRAFGAAGGDSTAPDQVIELLVSVQPGRLAVLRRRYQ